MILLKNREEIEKIRTASRYAAEMLFELKAYVKDGLTTADLEAACEERLSRMDHVRPAFKGYNGFPYCLCVSVNDEVVHGMPSERTLHEGDIVSLDFGVLYQGFYGDVAVTYPVGKITERAEKLLSVTERSLHLGIEQARVGNRLFDISNAVQSFVEKNGFSVVREFVGHGVGRDLHEEPQVPNFGTKGTGPRLRPGIVIAIEPMINEGKGDIIIKENGWTAATRDGKLSAHFEHTVAVTENGAEILSSL
ncbi:MAG TPA: type I methionyl aminopeptidase [Deltaproteobacteria bacterium]|nr:type I methionyl aminopeptidase [Deltaproteobacteria bacterium]